MILPYRISSPKYLGHAWKAMLMVLAIVPVGSVAESERLTNVAMDAGSTWEYRLDAAGQLWVAYYDASRLLRLRHPDGEEHPMVPEGRGQAPSGLAMVGLDRGAALMWRDKFPTKGLYLARSDQPDKPAIQLGSGTEPLARSRITRSGDRLDILWYGEAAVEGTSERYHLYTQRLNLETGELSPLDRVLPGIYPVWVHDPRGATMVFSWLASATPQRIEVRFRSPDSETFGDAVTVAETAEITPIFDAFRSGNHWFVVWVALQGADQAEFMLRGAKSDDDGATWQQVEFNGITGFDVGSLTTAVDDTGHIFLALSGFDRTDGRSGKHELRLIRSSDHGLTWTDSDRLRPSGHLTGFNARHPSVVLGSIPGQVMVVWEDWREIRARLYVSLSEDYGQTWTYANVPLPEEPGTNLGLSAGVQSAYLEGDRFNVIADQALDDSFRAKRLVKLSFTVDDLRALAQAAHTDEIATNADDRSDQAEPAVDDVRSEDALRSRVGIFWQAMMDGDYAETFELQDPFFRARTDPMNYLRTMGRIKYGSYRIDDVRIVDNRAEVKTTVRASVPPFRAKTGEFLSQPEKDVTIPEIWLWLDNNWYREFSSEAQETRATRY